MYFEDFAAAENEAWLELMYQDCNNREDEMNYSDFDVEMAKEVEILASNKVIKRNWENLGKMKPPLIPNSLTLTRGALKIMMEKEDRKYVVDGRFKTSFHDVWLAIDEGILWQPEEGKQRAESW